MRKRPGDRSARERGQALVETALSMLIVLVLLAGMVDFGIAFGYRVALENAARAGTRYGIRYPQNEQHIKGIALSALGGTLVLTEAEAAYNLETPPVWPGAWPDPALTIVVTGAGAGAERWDELTVNVSYAYDPVFASLLGVADIPLSSSSTMLIAGPDDITYHP